MDVSEVSAADVEVEYASAAGIRERAPRPCHARDERVAPGPDPSSAHPAAAVSRRVRVALLDPTGSGHVPLARLRAPSRWLESRLTSADALYILSGQSRQHLARTISVLHAEGHPSSPPAIPDDHVLRCPRDNLWIGNGVFAPEQQLDLTRTLATPPRSRWGDHVLMIGGGYGFSCTCAALKITTYRNGSPPAAPADRRERQQDRKAK